MAIKLHLVFQDRVGIVADVSRRIADRQYNIVAMEVDRVSDLAHVYVEAENRQAESSSPDLAEALADREPSHGLTPCAHLEREQIRNGEARFQNSRRTNDGQENRQIRTRPER